jgi:hypothetical protein
MHAAWTFVSARIGCTLFQMRTAGMSKAVFTGSTDWTATTIGCQSHKGHCLRSGAVGLSAGAGCGLAGWLQ